MNILFYQTTNNGPGERLREVICTIVSKGYIETYTTLDTLSFRLRRPKHGVTLAVLLAATKAELMGLLSLRDLFQDVRIILILPDRKKETITKGHTLYPRYLSYADGDFKDVAAVLEKMMGYINSNNNMR